MCASEQLRELPLPVPAMSPHQQQTERAHSEGVGHFQFRLDTGTQQTIKATAYSFEVKRPQHGAGALIFSARVLVPPSAVATIFRY
jgi:hypothetical protein